MPCQYRSLRQKSAGRCLPGDVSGVSGIVEMLSEYFHRLRRVRASIVARGLDGYLVTCPENRRYLSGFSAEDCGLNESSGALFIMRHEAVLLTDGRYEEQARNEAPGWRFIIYRKGLASALGGLVKDCGIRRMAYEPAYISCERFRAIRKHLDDTELVPVSGRVEAMRAVKYPLEIDAIRNAVQAAERIFHRVWHDLRPGMTEREVAWKIMEGLWKEADGPSFPPIVASGPNASLPHAVPTDRTIKSGEPVIVDMGARLRGYCSDMTRTIFAGEPDPLFREIYRIVYRAQTAAQDALKPGVTGREIDSVARSIIRESGYGREFVHSLGHGVGLAVHEAPVLSVRSRKMIRTGMVVTVEPGIYIPGRGGVRLENMALVTADGAEILNSLKWYYEY